MSGSGRREAFAQERHDVVRCRIPTQHRLREHELTVHVHVEDAAFAGNHLEDADHALPLLENPRRQTGGVRLGASGNAVLDADVVPFGHHSDSITQRPPRASPDEQGAVGRGREVPVGGDEGKLEEREKDGVESAVAREAESLASG
jgi:hypothetical protein